jgi:LacI family transcriptional regulator
MGVTIIDIARKAGVTRSTVSKVLNNSKTTVRVSDDTRARIIRVAKELDYRPSFSATSLAKGKTYTIGFLCGGINNPFFSELATIALNEAEIRGYHLMISVTEWNKQKELDCLDMLLRWRVDGIIMMTGALVPGTRQYNYIKNENIPVVLFTQADKGLSNIDINFESGTSETITHLISRGYSRIAMVYGTESNTTEPPADPKREAFQQSCKQHGLEPTEYIFPSEDIRLKARTIANELNHPQVVLCSSDHVAIGFIRGLNDAGIRVPQDIAVVGIDGTREGEYYCPSLTTIAVDPKEIIIHAMDILMEQIQDHYRPIQNFVVPTRLIVRSST